MKAKRLPIALTAVFTTLLASSVSAQTVISNKGSDTLLHLAQAWANAYHQLHPDVTVDVRGCGSSTGITALIHNNVDLANSSRPMKPKEIAEAEKNGVKPTEHVIAYDAMAIFVHAANPLSWMSVSSLAEIYGEKGFIDDWSKLGVTVPGCPGNKVHPVGRQTTSGSYAFFQETVLGGKREFKHNKESRDVDDTDQVLDLVSKNPCAIGYSGMAYAAPNVKKLKITRESGTEVVEASMDNAINRTYPLARPLFIYTNGQPAGAAKAYLEWVQTDAGQCIVQKVGFAPFRPVTCTQP